MTSIEKSLQRQPESLGAEIYLLMGGRSGDGRLLIVVEGKDDNAIYSKFYEEDEYKVWNSSLFPGCGDFVKTANELNETYSDRFIMIKDADFDHLDHRTYDVTNLFLTDTHDIETMMLTDEFFRQLATQSWGIQDGKSWCEEVMTEIIHLSYIKWMSRVEGRKIKFSSQNCSVGQRYDGKRKPDISDWLDKLEESKQPDDTSIPSNAEVELFENDHPEGAEQLLQITNGHDLMSAMNIKIKTIYHGKILKTELPYLLQSSYTKEIYRESKLYGAIAEWEGNVLTEQ